MMCKRSRDSEQDSISSENWEKNFLDKMLEDLSNLGPGKHKKGNLEVTVEFCQIMWYASGSGTARSSFAVPDPDAYHTLNAPVTGDTDLILTRELREQAYPEPNSFQP